jgi:hypothetical protein
MSRAYWLYSFAAWLRLWGRCVLLWGWGDWRSHTGSIPRRRLGFNPYYRILELAEYRIDYLTSPREVHFRELKSQIGPVFSSEEWDPPFKGDWAFDKAEVNLNICVRSTHNEHRPRCKGYPIHPGFKQDLESLPNRNLEKFLSNSLFSRSLSFRACVTLQ